MGLATIRKDCNMTQAQLGKAVGVSQRAISGYETGCRKPSPKIASNLAKTLGLSIEQMWQFLYLDTDGKSRCG